MAGLQPHRPDVHDLHARHAVSAADLDRIADELYALPPAEFTAARDAAVAEARRAGQRDLADAAARLRRPVAAAWAVNLLARHRHDDLHRVVELGAALRGAQDRLEGDELRRLSRQRQELVAGLARQAGDLVRAAGHEVSDAVLDDVGATLDAALVDPAAAAQVEAGRLTKPLPRPSSALGQPATGAAPGAAPGAASSPTSRADRQRGSGGRDAPAADAAATTAAARLAAAEAAEAHERARVAREQAEQELARVSREAADVERRLGELRARRTDASKRLTETRRQEDHARRALAEAEEVVDRRR